MTYASKRALRERNEWLQTEREYYYNKYAEKSDELTDARIEHRAQIECLRGDATRIVEREQEQYFTLAEAIKSFYGVSAEELLLAQETQEQLDDQKLLKDNLKKVKNANKTEEGK